MKPTVPSAMFAPEQLYPAGRYINFGEHLRRLAQDKSGFVPPVNNQGVTPKLDAIAIPTHRSRNQTRHLVHQTLSLANDHGAGIVLFICNDKASKEHIAQAALKFPRQQWLAIDWQSAYEPLGIQLKTTMSYLSRGKNFNVSEKRNFVLELAKLMGWRSVMFLDDDIEITSNDLNKAAQLIEDGANVVGFNVREFPDHSVVVHANQTVNSPVDSFMGTGALAVRTDVPFLSFFPNSYNNDWLFALLYSIATENGLVWAGTVKQKPYKPFKSPARAEREEPGDLLAEGLFRLVMDVKSGTKLPKSTGDRLALVAKLADETYWEKEITKRVDFIQATIERTKRKAIMRNKLRIVRALQRSLDVINGFNGAGGLSAQNFADWVQVWTSDLYAWNERLAAYEPAQNIQQALELLGYRDHHLYGSGVAVTDTGASSDGIHRHTLYDYFRTLGNKRLTDAVYSHDNRRFMQEFASIKGYNLMHIVRGVDQLRCDRPFYDTGIKPATTVVMYAKIGESIDSIKQSVQALVNTAKSKAPLQMVLWVYTDGQENRQQLNRFRNLVTSELVVTLKETNIILVSGVVKSAVWQQSIDQMIRDTSEYMLIMYWKLGRRPLPSHHFIIVNSRNQPLRVGTLKQLVRREYGIPNKSLPAYITQYCPASRQRVKADDKRSVIVARERLSKKNLGQIRLPFRRYLSRIPTYRLIWGMKRAKLQLPLLDDMAQTVDFHDARGWTSIQDIENILCLQVQYQPWLPGDLYGLARRITALAAKTLQNKDAKGCMIVVTGEHEDTWSELQAFRENVMNLVAELSQSSGVVFTSLVYRSGETTTQRQNVHAIKAMTRYVYWLENHRIRQFFTWRSLD